MSGGYGGRQDGGKAVKPELLVGSYGPMFEPPVTASSYEGNAFLASSFPGATMPMRKRYEPPRAPTRRPSMADWEVPPLELPTAPKRRTNSGSPTQPSKDPLEAFDLDAEDDEEEDEEEGGVFGLDGGDADEDDDPSFKFCLAGLDDGDEVLRPLRSEMTDAKQMTDANKLSSSFQAKRDRVESMPLSPNLGASPTLISALELVAAEAGGKSRPRLGTV
mmetsp:Transcript_70216/g.124059  ORF Transcript_70216/g.124059 Transcript_70216/m.124059 type:complete len:219 (+) Transcript_70216:108-764(+)